MSENRLRHETSPYLLQHQDNPVHWWAWGPDALAEAKRSGKPILLSVGYAACHWCHVMAHESFEDAGTASVMNELFVNIKVDREERPDIDAIYMGALHRLGQQGGWPMTMFLDCDARPFWGGTYFPKTSGWGRPAFVDVLHRVAEIFQSEPEKVSINAKALVGALSESDEKSHAADVTDALLRELTARMARAIDPVHGGIAGAPKFPQWTFFWLLWRGAIRYRNEAAKSAVITTLEHMCQGGIYDHLGGGFARYSVDERWLVPHFEKMLYDNALLVDLMTEVWRETKNPLLKARIAETIGWLEREMIAEGGGFAASLDADSEGKEGKFYVWSAAEISSVLGQDDAAVFSRTYGVTPAGNFEGRTILNRLESQELLAPDDEARLGLMRQKLLEARTQRIRPGWDDKVLADWNGLTIAALARAGRVFDHAHWVTLADEAFTFVAEKMTVGDRLVHSYRNGRGQAPATASDYANMIWAALRLFQVTSAPKYLNAARRWTEVLDTHYWLEPRGGYATTADDTSDVIVRLRSGTDDATPSANAMMVSNLASLALLTGERSYLERAEETLASFRAGLARNLLGHTGLLAASLDLLAPQLIVVVGDDGGPANLTRQVTALSLPGALEFFLKSSIAAIGPPALAGKTAVQEKPTAYICNGPQCSAPTTDAGLLTAILVEQRSTA
ncbi:MAG: thioredoxin domain-containing protein [Hyphomicrobium sp.]|jgi:hypothetical protein